MRSCMVHDSMVREELDVVGKQPNPPGLAVQAANGVLGIKSADSQVSVLISRPKVAAKV